MMRTRTVARVRCLSRLFATVLVPCAVGCRAGDAPDAPDATFLVEDSAGVEIVESAAPAWGGDGWRVAAEPGVRIGRTEGDERYLFGYVGGAIVLRDGRIAVLDFGAYMVRVYSPDGVHIEDWGGRGEGPGEFTFPPMNIFPYRGDSILVSEMAATRLTIFDSRGQFGRSVIPEMRSSFASGVGDLVIEGSVIPSESCCNFWGPLSTGAFLLSYPELVPVTGSGMQRASASAAIIPDSGGAAHPVGDFKGGRYQPGRTPQTIPTGFQFRLWFHMAAGPDGYFTTESDAYSVNEYDTGGRLRTIIRLAREPRPVTDEVKAAHEARLRERILGPDARIEGGTPQQELQRMLEQPYPSHLPTFYKLLVDPDGNLWAVQRNYGVRDDGGSPEMNEYFVFGPDGRHLGVVEVPASLQVFQIGRDFMIGLVTDELGVHYVHRYEIMK